MVSSPQSRASRWLRRLGAVVASFLLLLGALVLIAFHTNLFLSSVDAGSLGTEAQSEPLLRGLASAHGTPERWANQGALVMRLRCSFPFLGHDGRSASTKLTSS